MCAGSLPPLFWLQALSLHPAFLYEGRSQSRPKLCSLSRARIRPPFLMQLISRVVVRGSIPQHRILQRPTSPIRWEIFQDLPPFLCRISRSRYGSRSSGPSPWKKFFRLLKSTVLRSRPLPNRRSRPNPPFVLPFLRGIRLLICRRMVCLNISSHTPIEIPNTYRNQHRSRFWKLPGRPTVASGGLAPIFGFHGTSLTQLVFRRLRPPATVTNVFVTHTSLP